MGKAYAPKWKKGGMERKKQLKAYAPKQEKAKIERKEAGYVGKKNRPQFPWG